MEKQQHWTSQSATDLRFFVASDFVTQIQNRLSSKNLPQSELAKRIGVTEGRISQIFNNPGNLTLNTMVQWARSLDLKLTVMTYNDGDSDFHRGPILSDVFHSCWSALGKPLDNWEFVENARIHLTGTRWTEYAAPQQSLEYRPYMLEVLATLTCEKKDDSPKRDQPDTREDAPEQESGLEMAA